jgi:hypothetical protein
MVCEEISINFIASKQIFNTITAGSNKFKVNWFLDIKHVM